MSAAADDVIPWPVNAEVWAWLLGIITGTDRFTIAVLWVDTRAWKIAKEALADAFGATQYRTRTVDR